MEVSVAAIFILVAVTMVTVGWRILNWVWVRPKYLERRLREQGFAGNPYRIFFGDLKESSMMSKQANSKPINFSDDISPRVVLIFHHTLEKYEEGRVESFPSSDFVYVDLHPTTYAEWSSSPCPYVIHPYYPFYEVGGGGANLQVGEGVAEMLHAFYQSCNDTISQWERLIGEEGSCELDVWPYIENLTGDVISRSAFGSSYTEGKRIFQLQKEHAQLLIKVIQSVYIPGWRFLPTKRNKRMKEIDREVRALLKGIINKRERERKAGNAVNDDLLGILMESNSRELRESGNEKNAAMSITDVIEECKQFYLAGQETTTVLLVWTMVLLSKYPNWQVRAREEVLQVFGKNKPDFDGLNHLKVVTMILHEVLRLYPPLTLMNRGVEKETKLGNLIIPAGVMICLPTILVHRDCELWGDNAKEFNPERFSEGVLKATKGQLSFFPFGGGPRLCVGQNFAMMEAKMALSLILQHFSFELSSSYTHAPFTILTLQPQFGAHIILHKL
uniref:Birch protein n=1 Tax=Betula platyphylla TaxID=78630 RepID=A0A9E9L7Z6_BETPL|nr:birch protein [Betula platyphylla]